MIGIIDCGVGNINSFYFFYTENNVKIKIIKTIKDITDDIDKIILVGVSSFDTMMNALNKYEFSKFLNEFVNNENNKLLGICCGMQVLGISSEEGSTKGLGLLNGKNYLLKSKIKPHLGWNNILIDETSESHLLKDVSNNDLFYFLHSYYFETLDDDINVSFTEYDRKKVACVVNKKNIYGVQFHPEKSHESGKKILINFSNL
jgi:glutamine amidotransferase